MVAHHVGNIYRRHYIVLVGILVLLLITCAALVSYAQTFWIIVPKYTGPVKLSGDAAIIATEHLTKMIRLLQNGGPPCHLSEAEAAKWSVEDEIKTHDLSVVYSKGQYLADYREEFLKKWQAQIEKYIEESPKGVFHIERGSSFGFPNPGVGNTGGSNAYFDAQFVFIDLKNIADNESWKSTDRDTLEKRLTPASDALMWMFQHLTKKGKERYHKGQEDKEIRDDIKE
jgi:hypothetical protein